MNSGFSGLLWCPEVRQAASEEDLIRRLQSAVFSPLAQVDSWFLKSPPWKQWDRAKNNVGEFLENWEKLETRCCEIIGWRMQLVPYLKAAFQRYAADGTPPFRALVLDDPKNKSLYTQQPAMLSVRKLVQPSTCLRAAVAAVLAMALNSGEQMRARQDHPDALPRNGDIRLKIRKAK